jgi:hypothetical protein
MATPTQPNPRADLDQEIRSLVPDGRQPQLYTRSILGVNALLMERNFPLSQNLRVAFLHNVTRVERQGMSSTTGHLGEVMPLAREGFDHLSSGNYRNATVCFAGSLGNVGAAMLAGSIQHNQMRTGQYFRSQGSDT